MSSQDTLLTEPPPARSRRLPLLIVVGVVAAAVVAVAMMLLPGSDDDVPAAAALTVTATPVATDDDQDQDGEDDLVGSSVPVTTYEVFLSRDPFERVVPEEVQQTSTSPDGTNTDGSSDNGSNSGDGSNSGGDADGSDDTNNGSSSTPVDQDGPACVGQQELVCNGQVVTLIDVTDEAGEPVAVIQVDTTVYEVRRGQTFASNFQVRAIDGSCVSLLYGDDGFQLCRGDTVLK